MDPTTTYAEFIDNINKITHINNIDYAEGSLICCDNACEFCDSELKKFS